MRYCEHAHPSRLATQVTKTAVKAALSNPRQARSLSSPPHAPIASSSPQNTTKLHAKSPQPTQLDAALIDAYLARRALDYLVGFNVSPVLWRKLPGARSAGRVQSVALRLLCEREAAVEAFRPVPFWEVSAEVSVGVSGGGAGGRMSAELTHLRGRRLGRTDLSSAAAAEEAAALCRTLPLAVQDVRRRPQQRAPQPPFTTSTLQQAASTQLGLGASATMALAQRLYEASDAAFSPLTRPLSLASVRLAGQGAVCG